LLLLLCLRRPARHGASARERRAPPPSLNPLPLFFFAGLVFATHDRGACVAKPRLSLRGGAAKRAPHPRLHRGKKEGGAPEAAPPHKEAHDSRRGDDGEPTSRKHLRHRRPCSKPRGWPSSTPRRAHAAPNAASRRPGSQHCRGEVPFGPSRREVRRIGATARRSVLRAAHEAGRHLARRC